MKPTFDAYMPELFKHEGGYMDHPRDPGGATNLGITLKTLSDWRGRAVSKHEVRTLKKAEATEIYRANYWNKISGDSLAAGPDAALFDVAVNSGVGRARQWAPLAKGNDAVADVKVICARRRSFFRSLKTFDVFGKGWMRRVNSVEAWCIAWAVKVQGGDVKAVLQGEAAGAKKVAKKQQDAAVTGTVVTGGGGAVADVNWIAIAVVAVPIAIGLGWLIYNAVANRGRAEALEQEAANV